MASVLKKRKLIYLFFTLGFLIPLAFIITRSRAGKLQADFIRLKPVDLQYTILANFTVEYPVPLEMKFFQEGTVKAIKAKEGDDLPKGQIIIELDDFKAQQEYIISQKELEVAEIKLKNAREEILPNLEEKLKKLEADLAQAELLVKRYRKLEKEGAITRAQMEKAENDYLRASSEYNQTKLEIDSFSRSGAIPNLENQVAISRARLELARQTLANTRVVAPYAGKVLKIYVQVGQKVNLFESAVRFVEKSPWILVLNIDQKDLPFLRVGLPAWVVMDAFPDKKLKGQTVYVCTEVDKEKNTCEIRLQILEDAPFIRHGLTGSAEILAKRYEKVLAVPGRFIKKTPDKDFVWVWENNEARLVEVQTITVGDRWVIIKNLPESTIVVDASLGAKADKISLHKEIFIQ
ncbi:MAG: efflux RND transporter periplasmic adaptor subunit [Candidatus Aminicenantales bacterium]